MSVQSEEVSVVELFLNNTDNRDVIHNIVAADATYISLNYENEELKKIMPWAGTSKGPQAFVDTFLKVSQYWQNLNFEVTEIFGQNENVAVFGAFTYKSNTLGKTATSPFSILAKVKNGKIVHFQFMEDTLATASTFKKSGTWTMHSDPNGKEVVIYP